MNRMDRRIFGVLFLSLFTAVTGVGVVVPLLPVFAHDLGAGGIYISMIFGAFAFSRSFFLPYVGSLSDRKGRKPFIVWGLCVYALVSLGFMFTEDVETLIVVRMFQGAASAMIMPVAQAYIGDITPEGRESYFMGLFNLSMYGSFSIGPVLGGFINDYFGIRATFGFMGVLALIGTALSFFMLPSVSEERASQVKNNPMPWRVLLKDLEISALFLYRVIYTACIGTIWCFLPVYADSMFRLSSSQIGILVMLGVLIGGLLQTPMGWVADRVNKPALILAGGLIVVVSMILFDRAGGFSGLFIANVLFGVGGGISMPALMGLAAQKGKNLNSMGAVMSLLVLGHSVGMIAGSAMSGIMMDYISLQHAFLGAALLMGMGTLLFMLLIRRNGAVY